VFLPNAINLTPCKDDCNLVGTQNHRTFPPLQFAWAAGRVAVAFYGDRTLLKSAGCRFARRCARTPPPSGDQRASPMSCRRRRFFFVFWPLFFRKWPSNKTYLFLTSVLSSYISSFDVIYKAVTSYVPTWLQSRAMCTSVTTESHHVHWLRDIKQPSHTKWIGVTSSSVMSRDQI
jgi:hypothetical protein